MQISRRWKGGGLRLLFACTLLLSGAISCSCRLHHHYGSKGCFRYYVGGLPVVFHCALFDTYLLFFHPFIYLFLFLSFFPACFILICDMSSFFCLLSVCLSFLAFALWFAKFVCTVISVPLIYIIYLWFSLFVSFLLICPCAPLPCRTVLFCPVCQQGCTRACVEHRAKPKRSAMT